MTQGDTLASNLLGDWLDHHAGQHPERVALELGASAITYRELRRRVDACALAFYKLGLRQGSVVAVLSSPRPEVWITFLAAARVGVVWLGLNPRYQLPELAFLVGDAKPDVLITIDTLDGRDHAGEAFRLQGQFEFIRHVAVIERRDDGSSSFAAWLEEHSCGVATPQSLAARGNEGAPALLVYTSGSSGRPKGVLLRQRELVTRGRTQVERFRPREAPRVINPFPVNHISGMHWVGLYVFLGGGTIRYQERFSAQDYVDAFRSGFLNVLILMPAMFKMLVDHAGYSHALLDGLDHFIFSGASMPHELVRALRRARCEVGTTYGMTESCGSVTYTDANASDEVLMNTIGRPHPDGTVRVADASGQAVAPGQVGEIQVTPAYCMAGYLDQSEATARAFTVDGWLRTGDLAELREDGNFRFAGRLTEVFKSGGYNVYPREVELCLEAHGSIALAAVVGVPDSRFDEVSWAYVVARDGCALPPEQEIVAWCKGQLANYKVPKRVVGIGQLPLLPSGKVDKLGLRRESQQSAEQMLAP